MSDDETYLRPPSATDDELWSRFGPTFEFVAEANVERERAREFPHDQVRWLKDAGFGALRIPKEDGGFGASLEQTFALLAGVAEADPNVAHIFRNHLAFVETQWVTRRLAGRAMPQPWASVDWAADPDWDWTSAARDTPDRLWSLWRDSVGDSDAAIDAALDAVGMDGLTSIARGDGARFSLRWVVVHLIEEYARHNGHADLIREAIDGRVGE